MNRRLALYAIAPLLLLAGCGEKKVEPVAAASSQPPAAETSNRVVLPADSPKLKELRIEAITTGEVPANEVVAPGKIEVNPNRVSHVVLPLAGRVVSVRVKIGDSVQQGEPLLMLESPDADAGVSAYLQAQAQVSQAKTALLKARTDLDRERDLYEHKAIANKEVLSAESSVAQAQATLDQVQASVQQTQRRMELLGLKPGNFGQQITVSAPISGKILELNVVPGEFRNDLSASLITIADLSSVWVSSDVPESDIRFIDPGERLDIELTAYPGEVFHGKVTRIADTVDAQTRTVKVRAELDNQKGRLRPEMFGKIRHVEGVTRMPLVPAAAIIESEGSNLVYREVKPGTFEPVIISVGNRVGDKIAVKSGISAGDRLVTDGVMLLRAN